MGSRLRHTNAQTMCRMSTLQTQQRVNVRVCSCNTNAILGAFNVFAKYLHSLSLASRPLCKDTFFRVEMRSCFASGCLVLVIQDGPAQSQFQLENMSSHSVRFRQKGRVAMRFNESKEAHSVLWLHYWVQFIPPHLMSCLNRNSVFSVKVMLTGKYCLLEIPALSPGQRTKSFPRKKFKWPLGLWEMFINKTRRHSLWM